MRKTHSADLLKSLFENFSHLLRSTVLIVKTGMLGYCVKVSAKELKNAHHAIQNGAIIIDLRKPEKYIAGHLANAISIPAEMIEEACIDLSKDAVLVLYCGTGAKSAKAAKSLRKKGWRVYNLGAQ